MFLFHAVVLILLLLHLYHKCEPRFADARSRRPRVAHFAGKEAQKLTGLYKLSGLPWELNAASDGFFILVTPCIGF